MRIYSRLVLALSADHQVFFIFNLKAGIIGKNFVEQLAVDFHFKFAHPVPRSMLEVWQPHMLAFAQDVLDFYFSDMLDLLGRFL